MLFVEVIYIDAFQICKVWRIYRGKEGHFLNISLNMKILNTLSPRIILKALHFLIIIFLTSACTI